MTLELVTTIPRCIEQDSNELTISDPVEPTDPDPVEVATRKITELRLQSAKNSLITDSEIGRWVEEVRADSRYGDKGVSKLARLLDAPANWLRRLSARSRAFPPDDTKSILERAQAKGFVIGPSHLDELVPVEDALRRVLLDRCVDERMTVKQLRAEIDIASPKPKVPSRSKPLVAQGQVHLSALQKIVSKLIEEYPILSTQAERQSFVESYNMLSTAYCLLMEHWVTDPAVQAEEDIDSGWDQEKK